MDGNEYTPKLYTWEDYVNYLHPSYSYSAMVWLFRTFGKEVSPDIAASKYGEFGFFGIIKALKLNGIENYVIHKILEEVPHMGETNTWLIPRQWLVDAQEL